MAEKISLSDDQKLKLGYSAFSDALDFFSSINSAQNQRAQFNMMSWQSGINAIQIERNAQDIVRQGRQQENIVRENALRERGYQVVSMGASGFSVSSKSYQNILEETDRNLDSNLSAIRASTMSSYANAKYNQRIQEIQSSAYRNAAKRAGRALDWGSLVSAGLKTYAALGD